MITVSRKPPKIALCDNRMQYRFTTDLTAGTLDVFLLIEPWYVPTNEVTGTEVLYPEVPGSVETELGEYLRTGLQSLRQFVFPEQGNVPWNARSLSSEYKLKIQECYTDESGDPVVNTTWLEDMYVVRGRIPKWKMPTFYAQYTSFMQWQSSTKQFLTFSPSEIVTTPTMVQKLYRLIDWEITAGDKIKLHLGVTFTDGSTATYEFAQESAALERYKVFEFAVGYSVLALGDWCATNHPGKTIRSYTVTAKVGATTVSETKTYTLDYSKHLGEHQFIFANSLAGYDTMLATGNTELNSEYQYEVVDQQSPGVLNLPKRKQLRVEDTNTFTCRTGYMSATMADYLAEFFLSNERYEIVGSSLIPIVLFDVKVLRKRDNENIFFAEFTYQHSVEQKVEVGS